MRVLLLNSSLCVQRDEEKFIEKAYSVSELYGNI